MDLAAIPDCDGCDACWTLTPVHVDLAVRPLPSLDAAGVCVAAGNGGCAPALPWRGYDLGCARAPGAGDCRRPLLESADSGEPRDFRNPQTVKVAVATILVL